MVLYTMFAKLLGMGKEVSACHKKGLATPGEVPISSFAASLIANSRWCRLLSSVHPLFPVFCKEVARFTFVFVSCDEKC